MNKSLASCEYIGDRSTVISYRLEILNSNLPEQKWIKFRETVTSFLLGGDDLSDELFSQQFTELSTQARTNITYLSLLSTVCRLLHHLASSIGHYTHAITLQCPSLCFIAGQITPSCVRLLRPSSVGNLRLDD
ncbi:uncharacterized protein [Centruroides vittatus]|uniref:uncharacterized protein n=1 Tax=Centruroides vittatus TaxID=120091 RepID=UPI00351044A9